MKVCSDSSGASRSASEIRAWSTRSWVRREGRLRSRLVDVVAAGYRKRGRQWHEREEAQIDLRYSHA